MKSRLIVAAIGLPLILVILCVLPPVATTVLFAAVNVLGSWELYHILHIEKRVGALALTMAAGASTQVLILLRGYESVYPVALPVAVAGISNQYTSHLHYVSPAQAEAFGSPVFAAVMLRSGSSAAAETVLQDTEGYLFFSDVDEMKESAASLFQKFYIIVDILIAFSLFAGLMVVLVTARTALLERRREICVMRSVGFSVRTISVSWLAQSLVQFLVGCALGLPSGMALSRWVLDRISMPKRTFPYVSGARELLLSVLLLALYLLIGHAVALRSIRKWNLAEAVKSSE